MHKQDLQSPSQPYRQVEEKKKILAIIVTYNGMKWANRCFSSLEESSLRPDVYVVDNCSNDGTQEYVRNHYPSVTIVENRRNLGFGQANNIGLQFALDNGYDYVYLMNQDAWVMPDTLSELVRLMEAHPDYGILSPMQMESNGNNLDNNFASLTLGRLQYSPKIINDMYFERVEDVYEVSFVMASHWMISASCLRKTGGFSPTFHHYGEDNNYIQRAQIHDFKAGIAPGVHAIHDREYRQKTKKDIIFFNFYNVWAVNLSTPSHLSVSILFMLFLDIFSKVIEYKSLQPFKEAWSLLCHARSIYKNRKVSMSEDCAFLRPPRS